MILEDCGGELLALVQKNNFSFISFEVTNRTLRGYFDFFQCENIWYIGCCKKLNKDSWKNRVQ